MKHRPLVVPIVIGLVVLLVATLQRRESNAFVFHARLEQPVNMVPHSEVPFVQLYHDGNIFVPATVVKIIRGSCPYKMGQKLIIVVDDPKYSFGTADYQGKIFELRFWYDPEHSHDYNYKIHQL